MINSTQFLDEQSIEVGYIIAYDDNRRDRFGQFPVMDQELEKFTLFKKIIELEPSARYSSYIFSSVRVKPQYDETLQTIEYKKEEIKAFLQLLAQPGIKKRL